MPLNFHLDELCIGRIDADRVHLLTAALPTARLEAGAIHWRPGTESPALRSLQIQAAAASLLQQGAIRGWRDEVYRCERPVADPCKERGEELFQLERAAFRFFGLMSRAVHVNGLRRDGRVWCGRRAMSKAIDPGRLDNLAAGGLPAGETLLDCARRELLEEAGVPAVLAGKLDGMGTVRTQRREPEGWHDEVLHVFNLLLPDDFVPGNQDGEVSEFLLLDGLEISGRIDEFTVDAAQALMQAGLVASSRRLPADTA